MTKGLIEVKGKITDLPARYSALSGLSGIIAGALALVGCVATVQIWESLPTFQENLWYVIIWVSIPALTAVLDRLIAEKKARKIGRTTRTQSTNRAIAAFLPGLLLAAVLHALFSYDYDVIPAILAIGYGVSLFAAGMFSVRELRIFGLCQLITGALGLFILYIPVLNIVTALAIRAGAELFGERIASGLISPLTGLLLMGLCFGVYHIAYGS